MTTATFDRTATLTAIDHVASRLVEMVTTAPDTTVRVPATPKWTVAETFAHVATVAPRYGQGARHEGEWTDTHAGALHRPWPVDPAHIELIMQGVTPVLPGWLDTRRARDHSARYEVRLRGFGVHRFAFDHGRLTMNPSGPFTPDVVISAEPLAFLLVVYKRVSQWPAILTGRLAAWGRRPWLALTFSRLFHEP